MNLCDSDELFWVDDPRGVLPCLLSIPVPCVLHHFLLSVSGRPELRMVDSVELTSP